MLFLGDHELNPTVHDEASAREYAAGLMDEGPNAYVDFVREYALRRDLDGGWAILAAHGEWSAHLGWVFIGHSSSGRPEIPVSQWVAQKDGEYACILLHICNPWHQYPSTEHSLLVVPRGDIGGLEPPRFDLKVPGIGVAFDSDEVDGALARLRAGDLWPSRQ